MNEFSNFNRVKYQDKYAAATVTMWRASKEKALGINENHSFRDHLIYLKKNLANDNAIYLATDDERVVGFMATDGKFLNHSAMSIQKFNARVSGQDCSLWQKKSHRANSSFTRLKSIQKRKDSTKNMALELLGVEQIMKSSFPIFCTNGAIRHILNRRLSSVVNQRQLPIACPAASRQSSRSGFETRHGRDRSCFACATPCRQRQGNIPSARKVFAS